MNFLDWSEPANAMERSSLNGCYLGYGNFLFCDLENGVDIDNDYFQKILRNPGDRVEGLHLPVRLLSDRPLLPFPGPLNPFLRKPISIEAIPCSRTTFSG